MCEKIDRMYSAILGQRDILTSIFGMKPNAITLSVDLYDLILKYLVRDIPFYVSNNDNDIKEVMGMNLTIDYNHRDFISIGYQLDV